MIAKTFVIKKIATMRDKRSFKVDFELANGEWSNFFELSIKKDEAVKDVRERIVNKVKDMVAVKDRENKLMRTIVGKDISLNGADEKDGGKLS